MAVKIRLQRRGRKKAPFYHIVVADARSPRDGRFIEKIGTYNPMTSPATIDIDRRKAFDWIMNGAQPTDTARAILRFKGVMYRKHLQRGVNKGALTLEQAETMWQAWIDEKEAKIAARSAKAAEEIANRHKALSGKAKKVEVAPAEEVAAPEAAEAEAPAETPAAEENADAPVAEAPAAEETAEAPAAEETPEAPEAAAEEASEAPADDAANEAGEEEEKA